MHIIFIYNFLKGSNGYKSAFNGKEKETEFNEGVYDFGARLYDGRLGRWMSVDPLIKKYPFNSPYCANDNNPIYLKDFDGRDAIVTVEGNTISISTVIHIYGKDANAQKALDIQKGIMDVWGKDYTYTDEAGKVYNVKFNVQVVHKGEMREGENRINVNHTNNLPKGTSSVNPDGNTGNWGSNEIGNVYAHEFGHFLGIDDQYKKINPKGENIPENVENYEGVDKFDIMGKGARNPNAFVTKSSIDAIAKHALENAPPQVLVTPSNPIDRPRTLPYQTKLIKGKQMTPSYTFTLKAQGMPFRNRKANSTNK